MTEPGSLIKRRSRGFKKGPQIHVVLLVDYASRTLWVRFRGRIHYLFRLNFPWVNQWPLTVTVISNDRETAPLPLECV